MLSAAPAPGRNATSEPSIWETLDGKGLSYTARGSVTIPRSSSLPVPLGPSCATYGNLVPKVTEDIDTVESVATL